MIKYVQDPYTGVMLPVDEYERIHCSKNGPYIPSLMPIIPTMPVVGTEVQIFGDSMPGLSNRITGNANGPNSDGSGAGGFSSALAKFAGATGGKKRSSKKSKKSKKSKSKKSKKSKK
jgi:hypothetical protein